MEAFLATRQPQAAVSEEEESVRDVQQGMQRRGGRKDNDFNVLWVRIIYFIMLAKANMHSLLLPRGALSLESKAGRGRTEDQLDDCLAGEGWAGKGAFRERTGSKVALCK